MKNRTYHKAALLDWIDHYIGQLDKFVPPPDGTIRIAFPPNFLTLVIDAKAEPFLEAVVVDTRLGVARAIANVEHLKAALKKVRCYSETLPAMGARG
jgi:hypothetical protein